MRPWIIGVFVLVLVGCRKDPALVTTEVDGPFLLLLPPGAPMPSVPENNPLTRASVALGKALFNDPRLSRDGTISCATCHHADRAFSDTVALSLGIDGQVGMRNAPSLGNVAYHTALFRDGGVSDLERQAIAPIHDPLEMGSTLQAASDAVAGEVEYQRLSLLAYGRSLDPFVITRSLSSYQRTLISGWSRYDRYMYQGQLDALTEAELHGLQLFNSAALNCTACHNGFDLSDHSYQNIGQYLEYSDRGRERITLDQADLGKFKVPSLRNVALTGPYMHDGAMGTLEEVVDHFASGGLPHPAKSALLPTFVLTAEEKADLIAFLRALTDERSLDQVP